MKYFFLHIFASITSIAKSQTITLKIAGITNMNGEKVLAFETSDTTFVSPGSGSGNVSSVAKFELVKIKKVVDASTNDLFKRSISGNLMPEVLFEFSDASNAVYYKILIRDVLITHFSFLSPECSNCSSLFHQVWFSYSKIEWTDATTGNTTGYDLQKRIFY